MEKGDVVLVKFALKSFQWGNGLFVVHEIVGDTLLAISLQPDGTLEGYVNSDNVFVPSISGMGMNNEITKTNLKYQF